MVFDFYQKDALLDEIAHWANLLKEEPPRGASEAELKAAAKRHWGEVAIGAGPLCERYCIEEELDCDLECPVYYMTGCENCSWTPRPLALWQGFEGHPLFYANARQHLDLLVYIARKGGIDEEEIERAKAGGQ